MWDNFWRVEVWRYECKGCVYQGMLIVKCLLDHVFYFILSMCLILYILFYYLFLIKHKDINPELVYGQS